jgi:hypothetical protein
MSDEVSVKHEDIAQDHIEVVTADLVTLTGHILNRINNKHPISPQLDEYKLMSSRYYECVLNAAEIVKTTPADYILPSKPLEAVWKIREFVNRLKKQGVYRVGREELIMKYYE